MQRLLQNPYDTFGFTLVNAKTNKLIPFIKTNQSNVFVMNYNTKYFVSVRTKTVTPKTFIANIDGHTIIQSVRAPRNGVESVAHNNETLTFKEDIPISVARFFNGNRTTFEAMIKRQPNYTYGIAASAA